MGKIGKKQSILFCGGHNKENYCCVGVLLLCGSQMGVLGLFGHQGRPLLLCGKHTTAELCLEEVMSVWAQINKKEKVNDFNQT